MAQAYDVAVIGGGVMGLSTAYYLSKQRQKVILIEKKQIGSGSSGACDDMILLQSKQPGIALQMALESLELYKSLSSELGMDLEFENRGGMILIETKEQLQAMEVLVKQQNSYGLKVDIIDQMEVRKKQPFVSHGVIASTFSAVDSQVNPFKVMLGFLQKGTQAGLEIRKEKLIRDIEDRKDSWTISLENEEEIKTEKVVCAAGSWSKDIGKLIGIDIPIEPKKGQVIVTEQVPSLGDTNCWSAEYVATKIRPDIGREKTKLEKQFGLGFAFTQTRSGNYLIGSTREDVGFDKSVNYEALKLLIRQGLHYFPKLKDVHMIRSFAGFRPSTPDNKAIMGEIPGRKGFYVAAGHEGDGIALAPITGKLTADLILGQKVDYNLEELNMARFG